MLTALLSTGNLFKVLLQSATDGTEGDGSEQKLTKSKRDGGRRMKV